MISVVCRSAVFGSTTWLDHTLIPEQSAITQRLKFNGKNRFYKLLRQEWEARKIFNCMLRSNHWSLHSYISLVVSGSVGPRLPRHQENEQAILLRLYQERHLGRHVRRRWDWEGRTGCWGLTACQAPSQEVSRISRRTAGSTDQFSPPSNTASTWTTTHMRDYTEKLSKTAERWFVVAAQFSA